MIFDNLTQDRVWAFGPHRNLPVPKRNAKTLDSGRNSHVL